MSSFGGGRAGAPPRVPATAACGVGCVAPVSRLPPVLPGDRDRPPGLQARWRSFTALTRSGRPPPGDSRSSPASQSYRSVRRHRRAGGDRSSPLADRKPQRHDGQSAMVRKPRPQRWKRALGAQMRRGGPAIALGSRPFRCQGGSGRFRRSSSRPPLLQHLAVADDDAIKLPAQDAARSMRAPRPCP